MIFETKTKNCQTSKPWQPQRTNERKRERKHRSKKTDFWCTTKRREQGRRVSYCCCKQIHPTTLGSSQNAVPISKKNPLPLCREEATPSAISAVQERNRIPFLTVFSEKPQRGGERETDKVKKRERATRFPREKIKKRDYIERATRAFLLLSPGLGSERCCCKNKRKRDIQYIHFISFPEHNRRAVYSSLSLSLSGKLLVTPK